jgi:hypothetical protein
LEKKKKKAKKNKQTTRERRAQELNTVPFLATAPPIVVDG